MRKADPNWVRKEAAFSRRPESAPYYTRPMVIDITGLHRHTIDRLIREGEFPKPLKHNPPELRYTNVLWNRKEFDEWWKESPLNKPAIELGPGERIIRFNPKQLHLIETATKCLMRQDHDFEKFILDVATERAIRICELTIRDLDPNDQYDSQTLAPKLERILQERERSRSVAARRRRTYSTPDQSLRAEHQPVSQGLDDLPSAG